MLMREVVGRPEARELVAILPPRRGRPRGGNKTMLRTLLKLLWFCAAVALLVALAWGGHK